MASKVFLFILRLFSDGFEFLREGLYFGRCLIRKRTSLVAENLFLRKQLAAYAERNSKPCRLSDTDRLTLLLLSRCFDWRRALVVVKPETLVRWHRKAFQLFWHWKSLGADREFQATFAHSSRRWFERTPPGDTGGILITILLNSRISRVVLGISRQTFSEYLVG